jgi:hypothetical protein
MKEVKLLNRVQAVSTLNLIFILAAIQEHVLESELAFNNCRHISFQCNPHV